MRNATILLAVAVVVAMAVPAYGATTDTYWTGGTESWHQDSNPPWSNGQPGSNSANYYKVFIDNGGTAQITSAVNFGARNAQLLVGYKNGNVSGLEIGAELYVGTTNGMWVGAGTDYDSGDPSKLPSTVVQTAGKVHSGDPIRIGAAYNGANQGHGKWTISGGSIEQGTKDIQLGGYMYSGTGHGHLKIVGTGPSKIECDDYLQLDNSVLEILLDSDPGSTGNNVRPISCNIADLTGKLILGYDTGYSPTGPMTVTVIDAANPITGSLTLEAPGGWSITDDGATSGTLKVSYVPEPATMALLGLGGPGASCCEGSIADRQSQRDRLAIGFTYSPRIALLLRGL